MKYIELAKKIIPQGVPYQQKPFSQIKLNSPGMAPVGNDSYKAGILIPDLDIECSIESIKKMLPYDNAIILIIEELLYKEGLISNNMTPKDFAIFNILHEIGHWYDLQNKYIKKELTGEDYQADYRKEMERLKLKDTQDLIKSLSSGSIEHQRALREFHSKYRENIFEIEADNYAIMKMRDMKIDLI